MYVQNNAYLVERLRDLEVSIIGATYPFPLGIYKCGGYYIPWIFGGDSSS